MMDVSDLVGRLIDRTYQSSWIDSDVEYGEVFLEISSLGVVRWPSDASIELVSQEVVVGLVEYDTVKDLLFEDALPIKGVWSRQGGEYGYSSPVLLEMENNFWLDFLSSAPASMAAVGIHPRTWRDIRREEN